MSEERPASAGVVVTTDMLREILTAMRDSPHAGVHSRILQGLKVLDSEDRIEQEQSAKAVEGPARSGDDADMVWVLGSCALHGDPLSRVEFGCGCKAHLFAPTGTQQAPKVSEAPGASPIDWHTPMGPANGSGDWSTVIPPKAEQPPPPSRQPTGSWQPEAPPAGAVGTGTGTIAPPSCDPMREVNPGAICGSCGDYISDPRCEECRPTLTHGSGSGTIVRTDSIGDDGAGTENDRVAGAGRSAERQDAVPGVRECRDPAPSSLSALAALDPVAVALAELERECGRYEFDDSTDGTDGMDVVDSARRAIAAVRSARARPEADASARGKIT